MVNETKSLAQILAVDFVENAGTGAIGSQQFRNGAIMAMSCYGGLITNGGATQFNLTITYQDLKPFVSALASSDLTLSTTNGTITLPADTATASAAGNYEISFHITLQRDSVLSSDQKFFVKLMKNATELCTRAVSIAEDTQYGCIAGGTTVALVAADVLKLQIAHVSGAQATLVGADFRAKRIG